MPFHMTINTLISDSLSQMNAHEPGCASENDDGCEYLSEQA